MNNILKFAVCLMCLAQAAFAETTGRSTPDIQEVKTSGLTAWLVEDHSQPLFSLQLIFENAGSSADPAGAEGVAMFTAALLDEGAGDLDALAFQKAIESKAIELSFQTDEDALVVNMRSLSENKAEALRLLGLALTKPRFDEEAINRKRAKALSVLKQAQTSPGYQLNRHFETLAFPNHVYGRDALGTEASLAKIDAADLKRFVQTRMVQENVVMAAAGDMDAATLKKFMEDTLSMLPPKAIANPVENIRLQNLNTLEVVQQPMPQSMVLFATPGILRDDPRFIPAYVFNHIMGGDSLNSKFGMAIRKEKGLTYSVNTHLDPMRYSSSWGGMFATRNGQASDAIQTLKDTASEIRTHGLTAEDLQKAKNYLTGAFVLSLDTNGDLVNYLNIMQRFKLGKDYLATRNARIDAVTLEEVNAFAKEWLDPHRWLIVVVGKPEGVKTYKPSATSPASPGAS